MQQTRDVVIVGGGGVGSAIAYFLRRLAPDLKVCVFERDPTYAHASTALAAGGIRQQFSTPENVLMSQFGFAFMSEAAEALATAAGAPDLGLRPLSYLRLGTAEHAIVFEAEVEMQRRMGASPSLLARADLERRYPWMRLEDVAAGVLGGPGEGLFDPWGLLQALRSKAIDLGAAFETGEVVALERDASGAVTGVVLADGRREGCGVVVDAAGPRAAGVARMAGLEIPVTPVKAQTFAFRVQDPPPDCPVVLDHVQGLQFKPEGAMFVASRPRRSAAESDEGGEPDFEVEPDLFDDVVWPALAHRAAAFETIRLARGWAGHIELNTFDGNPILGPAPQCANFIFACGFSGHGAQHLPAAGRAIAELIVHGGYRSLDLSRFGAHRLATGERVPETI
jgi:glycine/D-amino acid oxidase-like deaminating enzyme